MVQSALCTRPSCRRGAGPRRRPDRPLVQGDQPPVQDLVEVYRELADAHCDYAAAPRPDRGRDGQPRASSRPTAALAMLLAGGHRRHHPRLASPREPGGDRTRRCASRAAPPDPRAARVRAEVTACPGCGRTTSTVFQELAERVEQPPRRAHAGVAGRALPGVEEMQVAVMGCIVNGPGESKSRQHRHLPARHRRGPRARSTSTASKLATLEGAPTSSPRDFLADARGVRRGPLPARRGRGSALLVLRPGSPW